jgi:hypothetical protein
MRDPTDLRAQEADAEAQATREAQKRKQEIEDFKWLVAHKQGRRILWRLLSMSGVFRTSMTGNSNTFFNEGRRDIGLQLLAEVNEHSLDAYVLMLKESKND